MPLPPYQCLACGGKHPVGYCPLKLAGVEHCGLCGLAHFGRQRTCPHLSSEIQVATMLATLKHSPEDRNLVEEATKYLRMIRGDLVKRKKAKAEREERERLRRMQPQGAPFYAYRPPPGYPMPPPVPIPNIPPGPPIVDFAHSDVLHPNLQRRRSQ